MIGIIKKRAVLLACAAAMTISAFGCGAGQSSSRRNRRNNTTEATTEEITSRSESKSRPMIAANQIYSNSPYYDRLKWVYYGEGEGQVKKRDVDLFLIAPTIDYKGEVFVDSDDDAAREKFHAVINERIGIFAENTRVFAPYYDQVSKKGYEASDRDKEIYLQFAYADISEAFRYYLQFENKGRPIIIAGFSQGADMCLRLLKDYFSDEKLQSQLVAAYAIGGCIPENTAEEFPYLHFAQKADDTGVIVSFDCEAPEVSESIFCPEGSKIISINPLNWTTDSTIAKKELNKGACFMKKGTGEIESEVPGLCGCYIDPERGTLKVTNINKKDYPPVYDIFTDGSYRLYDYEFFYKNLQENVGVRIEAYKAAQSNPDTPAESSTAQTETTQPAAAQKANTVKR